VGKRSVAKRQRKQNPTQQRKPQDENCVDAKPTRKCSSKFKGLHFIGC